MEVTNMDNLGVCGR